MKILIINIIVLLSISLTAPIDLYVANKIAYNVNKQFNLSTDKSLLTVKSIETIDDKDTPIIYIYHLNPVGFILIPNSNKSEPYLAYSFEHNFRKENLPTNLSFMIDSYKKHIQNIITSDAAISADNQQFRDNFVSDNFEIRDYRNVSPLIDAEFDQSGSWNNTLTAETGFNGPLGCVAISMGQIMHYWGYPEQGEGSNYYVEDDLVC